MISFQEQNIDLQLEDAQTTSATITGEVKDLESNPIEGATIKIFDRDGKPYLHTVSDSLGRYTFSGLKSGSYSISCVKEDVVLTIPDNIYLQEDEVKTYNFAVSTNEVLNLCSIAGHVFKMETDQGPISEAIISLLNAETRETIATTTSAEDGEYVFYDVKAGSYIISVNKIGYKTSADTFVTAKDKTIVNVDIKLSVNPVENLGTVSGIITHTGIAVANAFVGLYKIDELTLKESLVATTRTNANGIYMFGKVESGQYKVKAKLNK